MNLNLSGKVILIAGASQGMGLAIAQQCAAEGALVSLAARDEDKLKQACQAIEREHSSRAIYTKMDASRADDIAAWIDHTVQEFGRIDGLLVNAGGPPMGGFEDFNDGDWQAAFDLTLLSAVRMIHAALPHMKAQGGSILTLTSSSVREPIDVLLLSNVMRAGVAALVKSLASQFSPYAIRVNNIIPGLIATDRIATLDTARSASAGISIEAHREQVWAQIPAKRYGQPQEFANAATFLLSDAASYINGTSLVVDGGKMKSL
ncbi:SDR family oxidoreductase [Reinekea sp.]|jgi:3-oxoacyl-[acyl-carrier protein] reductase|uniref:SDR family oxidoreductase n=1 Tax=Reinekea sp. TaxID=1970455 RepID=UPI002A840792|nr:SDR family oxidoreductase [Reinekea sp.]